MFHLKSSSDVGSTDGVSQPNKEHSSECEEEAASRHLREQYCSSQPEHCWVAIGGTRKHWGHTSPLYCG